MENQKYNDDGTYVVYSGRSSGPASMSAEQIVALRDQGHNADPTKNGYGSAIPEAEAVGKKGSLAKWAIRGREQQLIDLNGRAQKDFDGKSYGSSGNIYRGVSKINLRGRLYHNASNYVFKGELYKYTGYN